MNVVFRGWGREVVPPHNHSVTPVVKTGSTYYPGEDDAPLKWHAPYQALGKVEGVGLTGSFLVEFNFAKSELSNWLKTFAQAEPEAALRLSAQMQAEALIALAKRSQE